MRKLYVLLANLSVLLFFSCSQDNVDNYSTDSEGVNTNHEVMFYDDVKSLGSVTCGENIIRISEEPIYEIVYNDNVIHTLDNGYSSYDFICENGTAKFFYQAGMALKSVTKYIEVHEDDITTKSCEYMSKQDSGELASTTYIVNGEFIETVEGNNVIANCEELESYSEAFQA